VQCVTDHFHLLSRHLVLDPYSKAFEHSVAPSAAVTPHVSPPGSPLRTTVSPPHLGVNTVLTGDHIRDDVADAMPVIDAVLDNIVTASRNGVSQERRRRATESSGDDLFPKPNLEYGRQDDDNDAGGRLGYREDDDARAEKSRANHGRTRSYDDGAAAGESSTPEMPPHRYLFNCYVYQYNLIQMGSIIIEMVSASRLVSLPCFLFYDHSRNVHAELGLIHIRYVYRIFYSSMRYYA
jgi:hypothetical protein